MQFCMFGKFGFNIFEFLFGIWQVGGKWGSGFDDIQVDIILNVVIDGGVNFIDMVDVYENGMSELVVGWVVWICSEQIYVVIKCGWFINLYVLVGY